MAQTFTGEVRDGVVVFGSGDRPPEGARVRVEPIVESSTSVEDDSETLADRLRSVIGKAKGLPADFAEQHDHYIHGTPKR